MNHFAIQIEVIEIWKKYNLGKTISYYNLVICKEAMGKFGIILAQFS